jgi:hypothetical protein
VAVPDTITHSSATVQSRAPTMLSQWANPCL